MPRRRVHRAPQRGGDFLGIGNFFKNKLPGALKSAANFVKDQKLLSKGLSLIPHPAAQRAAAVAKTVGLGRRRRRPARTVVGRGRVINI